MPSALPFRLRLALFHVFLGAFCADGIWAREPVSYVTERGIAYHAGTPTDNGDDYQRHQCRLDLYRPENITDYPTIVWFHGGGLTGDRSAPDRPRSFPAMRDQGIALVSVGYRLAPEARHPDYLVDAGAAVAWTIRNIAARGGDPRKVFVAGISAGGYLSLMVGLDPRWLAPHGLAPSSLAGVISVSGQTTTHFNVKKWLGDSGPRLRPVIDENAPLHHVAASAPPICLIVGDRALDIPARVEENALLAATLKALRHPRIDFHEMGGLTHSTVREGSFLIIPDFVRSVCDRIAPLAATP